MKDKRERIKIRKSWTRNPAEKVVQSKKPCDEYDERSVIGEALDELEDQGDE